MAKVNNILYVKFWWIQKYLFRRLSLNRQRTGQTRIGSIILGKIYGPSDILVEEEKPEPVGRELEIWRYENWGTPSDLLYDSLEGPDIRSLEGLLKGNMGSTLLEGLPLKSMKRWRRMAWCLKYVGGVIKPMTSGLQVKVRLKKVAFSTMSDR